MASLAAAGALFGATAAEAGPALDKISERGKMAVCSKVDYRPFGYRDTDGTPIGLEHDLISDVQLRLEKKLGKEIEVERIPVIAANRIQFLEGGKCDLLIATMTDKPERRQTVAIVEPNYYSSGVNVMALKSVKIEAWDDIKGQRLCSSQGAFWNKDLQRKYNLDLLTFAGIAETEQALRDGRCIGLLTDDSLATSRLKDDRWGDFELKVDTIMDASWGAAIQKGDEEFYALMSETIADWHRSGKITELENKWGIKPTPWAKRMHEQYKNM
ncbi:transporter substrate-binding domain-containing protein [Pelagibius sp. CAU 1746]|uniref:transporter substrate-binding domain-containing protein n=1 Tax=Pelagibius sp. CAU 1746 TaxID=3140370 RepID=UPI00325BD5B4